VTRIAISGHRGLAPAVADLIDAALRAELRPYAVDGELVGLSCLADGADQLFARAVLDVGGKLEAAIPAEQYRDGLPDEAKPEYDKLFAQAATVHRFDFKESTAEAHMAASIGMVNKSDRLFAVWDGEPARSYGGTADVVAYARERDIPVTVIWPEGAWRA
jgi:hypothetical protein